MKMALHLEEHFTGKGNVDNSSYLPQEDKYTKMLMDKPTQKKKKAAKQEHINYDK